MIPDLEVDLLANPVDGANPPTTKPAHLFSRHHHGHESLGLVVEVTGHVWKVSSGQVGVGGLDSVVPAARFTTPIGPDKGKIQFVKRFPW